MINIPAIDKYAERWAGAAMRPLKITAVLSGAVVNFSNLHIDAILASTVAGRALDGAMINIRDDVLSIPLPLQVVWQNADALPLWATTDMQPDGEFVQDALYLHRRAPEPHMVKGTINTGSGAYKEKRTPLPVIKPDVLSCEVIGSAEHIADLLSDISSIGKKRHVANRVFEWHIEEIVEFSFFDDDGTARRPLPIGYLIAEGIDYGEVAREQAWTVPYWHVKTLGQVVPTGAKVQNAAFNP